MDGEKKAEWSGLKSVVMVISERKLGQGQVAIQKRFYVTSLQQGPEKIANLVRSHWSIENTLHWQLDVNFKERINRACDLAITPKISLLSGA